MSPWSRREELLQLLRAYLDNRKQRKQLQGRKCQKSIWIRELFNARLKSTGDAYILVNQLRLVDREYHFRYTRMSKERLDHLLNLISPRITKKDTQLRQAIPAMDKLYITLQFLADGRSQLSLALSYRIGRTTVSNIIKDVCNAIYEELR